MMFQDLIHFAPDPAAHIRRCIMIKVDMSIETNNMF